MDRRGFFKLFGIGVAGVALEQAIPLGRVWSFPKDIVIPRHLWSQRIPIHQFYLNEGGMPQRHVVTRRIGNHLYEVTTYPGAIPFKIIDAYAIAADPRPSALKTS